MKKIMFALPSLLAVGSALAEGGTTGTTSQGQAYAGSVAETIATGASTTLTNFLTGVAPVVATVLIAGLSIWGGIAVVGIIKKSFSAGKGR